MKTAGAAMVFALVAGGIALATVVNRPREDGRVETTPTRPTTPPNAREAAPAPGADLETESLRAEVAALRSAVANARARAETTERKVVNFQLLVEKLGTFDAAAATKSDSVDALWERIVPRIRERTKRELDRFRALWQERIAVELTFPHAPAYHDSAAVYERRAIIDSIVPGRPPTDAVAALGPPEGEIDRGKNGQFGRVLCYYTKGIRVLLDAHGNVESVEYVGTPESNSPDLNGRWGELFEKGTWYRPAVWTGPEGVEVGMLGTEVVDRLGPADSSSTDFSGVFSLYYVSRELAVVLDDSSHRVVTGFRRGGIPADVRARASGR